jgi:hypothetical protein
MKFTLRFVTLSLILILSAKFQTFAQQSGQEARVTKQDLERRKLDKSRMGLVALDGRRAAAFFEDRVEFFSLAPEISTGAGGFSIGQKTVAPSALEPTKILWLTYRIQLLSHKTSKYFLVCSNISLPKLQSVGLGDFCGIISIDGQVVFKFPVKQHVPDRMLQVLAVNNDGTYAEVFVGKLVPDEDGPVIAAPREILAWRYPNKLTRFPGPWANGEPKEPAKAFDDLLQGFKNRKRFP